MSKNSETLLILAAAAAAIYWFYNSQGVTAQPTTNGTPGGLLATAQALIGAGP